MKLRTISILAARTIFLAIILFSCRGKAKSTSQEGKSEVPVSFSKKEFETFFPNRNRFYSYEDFERAVSHMSKIKVKIETRGKWIYKITRTDKPTGESKVIRQDKEWDEPWAKDKGYDSYTVDYADFGTVKGSDYQKKEIAAFFAHIAHETRNGTNGKFDDGLMLKNEIDTTLTYIVPNANYPAVDGQKYYGRGPLQLSYNGNFGFASECIFGDKNILLKDPGMVSRKADVAFESAIFYWMTPQASKPSCHDVIIDNYKTSSDNGRNGFGLTINIINGALECNRGENNEAMQDRISFYKHFLKLLGIDDKNCECSCGKMKPFPA
ncbi:chitinase [Chryseobacterium soli]|uniref:chitinase n=1 Tax=Chryseobacterium soli TaxID=445961 RepID=UPI00068CF6E8|nr:chitinase [Chryseobacterium soli]